MAEKRMFTKKITESDAFLDMPLSTQCLYFHLNMEADDDGFVNNPKKIQRVVGCSDDDFKLLIAKNFIICFETGVIVIKHWRLHNYIQKDRYKPTEYVEEKALLGVKDNNVYTLDTECVQNVRVDKISIDKISIDKNINNIYSAEIKQIIDYLNLKCGTRYTYKNKTYNSHIKARLDEGFTVEDFKTVIDNKTASWLKDKRMCMYLRPQTLFCGNFESYLNEKGVNAVGHKRDTVKYEASDFYGDISTGADGNESDLPFM